MGTDNKRDKHYWGEIRPPYNHAMIDDIVQGAVNTVQAVLPQMKAQNMGKIINISTNLIL